MRRYRCTKMVATLGPASSSAEVIKALFQAGVDVFRLNFSHGTHAIHAANVAHIRACEKKYNRPIGILMDLQGPKLRVSTFENGAVTLKEGQDFTFDLDATPGNVQRVNLPHEIIFQALKAGDFLLLDDGRLRLRAREVTPKTILTVVEKGGVLSDRKGVNVPSCALGLSALTPKDHADLQFGLTLGVDFVALSFVQRPEDIVEARQIIGQQAAIVAKLEKPQALEHLAEITALADAIMVARGDLGVEMDPEEVPVAQRRIIQECREQGKPVIVATQMLESMVHCSTPTRAEASDVATAVYEGADAVMLSAESASGDYPLEAVSMMNRIMVRVEKDPSYHALMAAWHPYASPTTSDAITAAARKVAETIHAVAILTLTSSGITTLRQARERPKCPILSLTPSLKTARRMTLTWSAHPLVIDELQSSEAVVTTAARVARAENFAQDGDHVVITAGGQFGASRKDMFRSGTTRALRILTLGEEAE